MQVGEFLKVYKTPAYAPETGVALYDQSRLIAHAVGNSVIDSLQGEEIPSTFLDGFEDSINPITKGIAQKYEELREDESSERAMDKHFVEGTHHFYNVLSASMTAQLDLLFDSGSDFATANLYSNLRLSIMGAHAYDSQRKRADKDPAQYYSPENRMNRAFSDGSLNELDTAITLLHMARYQRNKHNRELIILPAPPQIEWYPTDTESDKNHHADFLIVERKPDEELELCGVQVKSLVIDKKKDAYDHTRMVMVCGNADLGNYASKIVEPIRQKRQNKNWAGQISIESLANLLKDKNGKKVVDQMINGPARKQTLTILGRHSLNKGKSKVDIRGIQEKIWPRVERVLG